MAEITRELYMNLHKKQDHFARFADVSSVLRYGTEKYVECPFISFVVPTYKREKMLYETINSILSQPEIVPYEVIVVDNSTDMSNDNKTYRLIKTIRSEKILYYVNEKNLGQAGNWNRCFSLARGKYVAMVHDDDLLKSDYLEQMLKCIAVAERFLRPVGVIRPLLQDFVDSTNLPVIESKNRGGVRRFYKINALAVDGIGPSGCPTCGMIFNRKGVLEVGGFNPEFYPSHDYVLGYQLLRSGYNAFVTEDKMGYYRIADNASMKKEVLLQFCKCDYYFREFLYSESISHRIFGMMFRNVQYSLSVTGTQELSKRFGQDISLEEIAFCEGFGEYKYRTKLYLKQRDFLCKKLDKKYFLKEENNMSGIKNVFKKIYMSISPVYRKLDYVQKDIWEIKENTMRQPAPQMPVTGHSTAHNFIDRKKDYDKVLLILAGYKREVWDITIERIQKFLPVGIDVCVVTSGCDVPELKNYCEEYGWSYLSTQANCLTMAQNIAIQYHPSADWIYKIDEDMFITEGFFENMMDTYYAAERDNYVPAFVAPIINVNGFGYVRILKKYNLVEEWEKRFGKVVYTDGLYHNKSILTNADAAKYLWGKECCELRSIDAVNAKFRAEKQGYSLCPFRFSIGAVLFKKKAWENWGGFPVPQEGNGLGLDETTMCYTSIEQARAIIISENSVVGHLGFGPQSKEMTKYFLENKRQFELKEAE